jgi:hypothetical protein
MWSAGCEQYVVMEIKREVKSNVSAPMCESEESKSKKSRLKSYV